MSALHEELLRNQLKGKYNYNCSNACKDAQCCTQARSQKFAMGGAVLGVWGRSPQPPEANGGLGAKPPAAGGWGFGGKAPSRRRHGGLGAEPPALENFAFFLQK